MQLRIQLAIVHIISECKLSVWLYNIGKPIAVSHIREKKIKIIYIQHLTQSLINMKPLCYAVSFFLYDVSKFIYPIEIQTTEAYPNLTIWWLKKHYIYQI